MSSKLCNTLVEEYQIKPNSNRFIIWADAGLKNIIKGVAGVAAVYEDIYATRYIVYVDLRYDIETVLREIKDAVDRETETPAGE